MLKNVMIDIETYSTFSHAIILSVAARKFSLSVSDIQAGTDIDPDGFYAVADWQQQQAQGRLFDIDTVIWWQKRPEVVRQEVLCNPEAKPLVHILEGLAHYVEGCHCVWANGIDFDINILEDAYHQYHMKTPWHFSDARDARTIYKMFPVTYVPVGDAHNAKADVLNQIRKLQTCSSYYKFP